MHLCILWSYSLSDRWPAKGRRCHVAAPGRRMKYLFTSATWYLWQSRCGGYRALFLLEKHLQTNPGFALRQDVLPMLRVNSLWPLSTKNVPMSCGSGCRYENVRLQRAVMYTRGEGEGSACGWWPAEAPDVQRCLGLVPCCKCVVRSRLPDTHWGIWAADDGSLFPACKINCRLLRIYNMKMWRKRNSGLARKEDVRVQKEWEENELLFFWISVIISNILSSF